MQHESYLLTAANFSPKWNLDVCADDDCSLLLLLLMIDNRSGAMFTPRPPPAPVREPLWVVLNILLLKDGIDQRQVLEKEQAPVYLETRT